MLPVAAVEGWSLSRFGPVARAFRAGGTEAASALLPGGDAAQADLLLGLYAAEKKEAELAARALGSAADPSGLFEDWRLYRLAEALESLGDLAGSRRALESLISARTASPLYARAYLRHLEVTRLQGDWLATLRGVEAARQTDLAEQLGAELARLEWSIAVEREIEDLRQTAARRLLIDYPIAASELEVIEIFRAADGIDWASVLEPGEQRRRAASLLAAGIVDGALEALAAIAEEGRDLDWSFLEAEALTVDRRGVEALEVLARRPPTPHDRLPDLWRRRAAAARDAFTVRSGRRNATTDERQAFRDIAWRDLWQLATKGDTPTRLEALRRIYKMADVEENYEQALDALRRMRDLDPADIEGYRDLWKLGWREFDRRNASGAIGIWRDLQDLYPETSRARQALYWSGVAHQELGNAERGRDLLAAVLETDTVDFYARHAARRLGASIERSLHTATEEWPDDPVLARAALLSELGLDGPAATELELLRETSDPRAADALEALILARQDERRRSMDPIWRAFRNLGKPGQSAVPERVRNLYYPLDYRPIVERWAEDRGLPSYLVFGIIRQESAFDAAAVSRSGARGLMQVMPATGKELAGKLRLPYSRSRLTDPEYSVQLGTRYFAQVLDLFDGDVELALAGYNGGPYRIRRWWREAGTGASVDRFVEGLPLAETSNYVKRILIFEDSYELLYGGSG